VVKWTGLILAPVATLVLECFLGPLEKPLGIPRDFFIREWIFLCSPFAGVPFVWMGEGGWPRKTILSFGYVLLVHGVWLLPIIILIVVWSFSGGLCI